MKKLFLLMSMAAAMIPFAGCQKNEIKDPTVANGEGSTFELVADISQTKTTLDGLNVEWENGDIIYVVTTDKLWGADWSQEKPNLETIAEFKYQDGKFSTEATIADGEHTFNAMYARADQKSYHRGASSTHKLVATQQQNCTAPTAHIKDNDALVGTFTATTPMEAPAQVAMKHLYTMMQVNIKNNTGADVEVKKFEMTTAADLAGVFNVTSFDTPAITTKSGAVKTITVEVSGGTVANTASLPIYFVMAPLSEYSGDVTFKVTDAENKTYTKTVTVSDLTFEAGAYNTTPYTISKADVVEPEPEGTTTVTFDFTSSSEMEALNVTLPTASNGTTITTLSKGDVTFVAEGGSTDTRLWNSSGKYDLRAYKGATLTFSVPTGYVISDIIVEGSATTDISKSTMPSNPVVLTVAAGADTQKISSITVKYVEGEVEAVPLTMGTVTCINQTTNSLTFSWDEVTGAEGYKVSLDAGNTWGDQFTATNYTWEDLNPETDYTIYVKAVGNGINTLDSEAVSADGTTEAEQAGVETKSVEFTFTGANGQTDFKVTKAPITIALNKSNGQYAPNDHKDKHVRVYDGNTLVFSGARITKVELTYTESKYNGSGLSANDGTLIQNTESKKWTWIGKSSALTLTGGSTQGRYTSIVVYYESDGTLPDPVKLTMGAVTCSAQTANTLTFKWDAVDGATGYEVSFNSGDAEPVDATTYTAEGLTAETTYSISVKAVGDGTYYLTSDAKTTTGTTLAEQSGGEPAWTLVTDASTLKAGDEIIIVAKDSNFAISTEQKTNNRGQAAVTKSGNTLTFNSSVQRITLETGTKAGTFSFNVGSSKYLYAASSSSNHLKTGTKNDNASWKISIASNGVATIVAQGTNTRNTMQYNQSSSLFACYASASQKAVTIYRYE